MADNVYLLETRLSAPQQVALAAVRDAAREQGVTVFLVGGAVRDLMSGSPVRDLDFAVQGDPHLLRKGLEGGGAAFSGEWKARQAIFFRFPSGVRVEVGRTLSVNYPKPGKPVYTSVPVLEDLRRRDFTANAMALSLNEGSYGLLLDPLNGVADIENRELRLVSNYGFIEDPVRMIRATRLMARQGWQMEERTRTRYDNSKTEGSIRAMQSADRDYELEELFHEEDPLRVMRRLEEEGWLKQLSPVLDVSKADVNELGRLREVQMQLQTHGILADAAAANFPLLTAKLLPAEVEAIQSSFPRSGFVEEIRTLESSAKEFTAKLLSKEYAAPSKAYTFLREVHPATVLWAAYSSRSAALQGRLKSFYTEWPQAFGKVPYALLAEMRITPELPDYQPMIDKLVFAMMDGAVGTPEEMRAFLEPYSPPAPPPPPSLRRARAARKEGKAAKPRKKTATAEPAGAQTTEAVETAPAEAPVPVVPERPTPVAEEAAAPVKAEARKSKAVPAAEDSADVAVPAKEKTVPATKARGTEKPAVAPTASKADVTPAAKPAKAAKGEAMPARVEAKASTKAGAAPPRVKPAPPVPVKAVSAAPVRRADEAKASGKAIAGKKAAALVRQAAPEKRAAAAGRETSAKGRKAVPVVAERTVGKKVLAKAAAVKAAAPKKAASKAAPAKAAKRAVPAKVVVPPAKKKVPAPAKKSARKR